MAATLFVIAASRRHPGALWTVPNALTLSRGGTAALLAAVAGRRRRSTAAWLAAVLAATISDWLDGPLARKAGSASELGALLDLEADSWLTLWAAVAAYRTGALPAMCLLAPVARYPLAARRRAPDSIVAGSAGTLQMLVLLAALAPSARIRAAARQVAPGSAAAQLLALTAGALGYFSPRIGAATA